MNILFSTSGIVQHGKKRGRLLGVPTANIPAVAAFPEGIYVSQTQFGEKTYNSISFIGPAKTYGETLPQIETYIFDFAEEIYGQTITLSFLKKIRDNQKFESEQALIDRMKQDLKEAEDYFTAVKAKA